jgi:hypothetical protein
MRPTKAADLLAAVAVAVQRLRGCDTTDEGGAADDLLALLRSDPIAVELLLRNSGALFFMTLDALVETICNTEGAVRHDVSDHLCAVCVVAIDLVAAVAARGGEAEASPSTASSSSDDPPLALAARSPPPQPSPALEELRSAARLAAPFPALAEDVAELNARADVLEEQERVAADATARGEMRLDLAEATRLYQRSFG